MTNTFQANQLHADNFFPNHHPHLAKNCKESIKNANSENKCVHASAHTQRHNEEGTEASVQNPAKLQIIYRQSNFSSGSVDRLYNC